MSPYCCSFAENARLFVGQFVEVLFVFINIPASNAKINIFLPVRPALDLFCSL